MKNVTFYLGPATNLASRTLTVRRMIRAGDDSTPAASYGPTDQGAAATTATVPLADGVIFQATLADVTASGATIEDQVIAFHTGSLQHLGPKARQPEGSEFRVQMMEDLSSSSSSSSESSSSVSSSSQSSSSSSQS